MSTENSESVPRQRFRLFSTGTPKTYQQAASERLAKVSQTADTPTDAENDPCIKKEKQAPVERKKYKGTIANDPRFQQQNQTLRCYVMYTDFFRCEKILGEGHEACAWFQEAYRVVCPNDWIRHWDELRSKNLMPWSQAYLKAAAEAEKRENDEKGKE